MNWFLLDAVERSPAWAACRGDGRGRRARSARLPGCLAGRPPGGRRPGRRARRRDALRRRCLVAGGGRGPAALARDVDGAAAGRRGARRAGRGQRHGAAGHPGLARPPAPAATTRRAPRSPPGCARRRGGGGRRARAPRPVARRGAVGAARGDRLGRGSSGARRARRRPTRWSAWTSRSRAFTRTSLPSSSRSARPRDAAVRSAGQRQVDGRPRPARAFAAAGLRLAEVGADLGALPQALAALGPWPYPTLLVLDDLAFEDGEPGHRPLRSLLEGGLRGLPPRSLVVATSNRRHLVRERLRDRPDPLDDDVHAWDTHHERLALADRFGLVLTFPHVDRARYLTLVAALARAEASSSGTTGRPTPCASPSVATATPVARRGST
jgi:hypothetical protein